MIYSINTDTWARMLYVRQCTEKQLTELHELETARKYRFLPFEIRQSFHLIVENEITQRQHDRIDEIVRDVRPRQGDFAESPETLGFLHAWDFNVSRMPVFEYGNK